MVNATETAFEVHRCLSCGRPIRSAESIAAGRGKGCRAKMRQAAKQADLSAWTASQIEEARQAIVLGTPAAAAPARSPLALPAAPVPVVPDVWAALEAAGALDLIPAF